MNSNFGSFSTTKKTVTNSKSFLSDGTGLRQLYIIGAENKTNKRSCKFFSRCSSFHFLLLFLLLACIVAAIEVAPVVLFAFKTTTTVTISMNCFLFIDRLKLSQVAHVQRDFFKQYPELFYSSDLNRS